MTKPAKTFGTWENLHASAEGAISHSRMKLDSKQLSSNWRRCSLSSDFWAKFISLSNVEFSMNPPVRRDALESTLSYLLNELFENCAKFSGGPVDSVIFEGWLFPHKLAFQMTNHIEPTNHEVFIKLIDELLRNDPEELYFKRLEENAEADQKGSGLGYLTLMKDYNVHFGFRFTPVTNESIMVDVQAHIQIKEI